MKAYIRQHIDHLHRGCARASGWLIHHILTEGATVACTYWSGPYATHDLKLRGRLVPVGGSGFSGAEAVLIRR